MRLQICFLPSFSSIILSSSFFAVGVQEALRAPFPLLSSGFVTLQMVVVMVLVLVLVIVIVNDYGFESLCKRVLQAINVCFLVSPFNVVKLAHLYRHVFVRAFEHDGGYLFWCVSVYAFGRDGVDVVLTVVRVFTGSVHPPRKRGCPFRGKGRPRLRCYEGPGHAGAVWYTKVTKIRTSIDRCGILDGGIIYTNFPFQS